MLYCIPESVSPRAFQAAHATLRQRGQATQDLKCRVSQYSMPNLPLIFRGANESSTPFVGAQNYEQSGAI